MPGHSPRDPATEGTIAPAPAGMSGVILSAARAGVNDAGDDDAGEAFAPGCAIRYHGIRTEIRMQERREMNPLTESEKTFLECFEIMESYLAYRLYSIFEKMKSRNV